MPRRHSKTSRSNVEAREREMKAFEMRKAGATYMQIGDKLEVTKQGAHKMVKRVLDAMIAKTADDAVHVRELEIVRLDSLMLGLWPKARTGHEGAVDRVLRVMKRRAELMGLDAPTKIESETKQTVVMHVDPKLEALGDTELRELEAFIDEFIGAGSVAH